MSTQTLQFPLLLFAGWVNRQQADVIEYPEEENRALREKHRMAVENIRWGYARHRGALRDLGIELGRNTIKRILLEHGIEPVPERSKRMPWKTFLKAHWGEIAGIVHNPGDAWIAHAARNLVDTFAGLLKDHVYIILDRDPLYTTQFRLPVGVRHLRRAVAQFVEHYHSWPGEVRPRRSSSRRQHRGSSSGPRSNVASRNRRRCSLGAPHPTNRVDRIVAPDAETAVSTPEIPSARSIASACSRQTLSNATPAAHRFCGSIAHSAKSDSAPRSAPKGWTLCNARRAQFLLCTRYC